MDLSPAARRLGLVNESKKLVMIVVHMRSESARERELRNQRKIDAFMAGLRRPY